MTEALAADRSLLTRIDPGKVWEALDRLDDLREFAAQIARALAEPQPDR